MYKRKLFSLLRVGTAHPRTRGLGSGCGSPDKCHWCTCPGSQHCSASHPVPWVPVPRPHSVPVRDTWGRRGQSDRYIAEAIRNSAPGTGRHCRRSTAGLWSPLRREGSPGSGEEGPHAQDLVTQASRRLNLPESHRPDPTCPAPRSHLISLLFLPNSEMNP